MRSARIERATEETTVVAEVHLDGTGVADVDTGIAFVDHMLEAMATHGRLDLEVSARGDFQHHVAEDALIALGAAVDEALGDKRGIRRAGHALYPMDDALVLVAIDFGGRPYVDVRADFGEERIEDMPPDLYVHLLETFASNASCNLHIDVLRGRNDHHVAEAIAKGLGAAVASAAEIVGDDLPSSKGVIE
ncbi:MAG: imidazoleglycerol-phosphate dehydratase [Halobacteriales archaeon]